MAQEVPNMAATDGPDVSYKNLFNPLSPLMGGGDKYPEFVANMFPGNPRAAWLVSKVGAVGLLAAALAGAVRGATHLSQMAKLKDRDDPADNLKSDVGTTYMGALGGNSGKPNAEEKKQLKRASEVPKQRVPFPNPLNVGENVANIAIPSMAVLLAALGGWYGADKLSDNSRKDRLNEAIANKHATIKNLIQTRARIAKGNISDEEVQKALNEISDSDNYVKTASDPHPIARTTVTGLGLLLVALGLTGAAGAYKYFSLSNPNNIQYKAMKKGLKEYAKQKAGITPITTIPSDADEYFQSIDQGAAQGENPRELPEQPEGHREISVSL